MLGRFEIATEKMCLCNPIRWQNLREDIWSAPIVSDLGVQKTSERAGPAKKKNWPKPCRALNVAVACILMSDRITSSIVWCLANIPIIPAKPKRNNLVYEKD